jgi:hypothetical protein
MRGALCDLGVPFVSKLLINYYVMEMDLLDRPVPVTKNTFNIYLLILISYCIIKRGGGDEAGRVSYYSVPTLTILSIRWYY